MRDAELFARGDVELPEYFVQVILDGARADEQLLADVGIGEAVARKLSNVRLLCRKFITVFVR